MQRTSSIEGPGPTAGEGTAEKYSVPGARVHGGLIARPHPDTGSRPTVIFAAAALLTIGYVAFAVWASGPWRDELERVLGPIMAWVIPLALAYAPGLVIGFLMFTLLVSRYHEPATGGLASSEFGSWPAVTILIAARNEEVAIARTLEGIADAPYPGAIEVVLADNGSTDRTAARAAVAAGRLRLRYRRVLVVEPGKHRALNAALQTVETPLVITVDGDTILQPLGLRYLVARITSKPQNQHVCACAGALLPANTRNNLLTRMQQWDYRLGINGVKRMQAAYNSALVAQGAFSAYWTADLRAVGGWPDAIGEDIVLTWAMMGSRGITQYEPLAVSFTVVPERLGQLLRQRSRWARGMLEGLRAHPPATQPRKLAKVVASIDYLVPVLDFGFIFFWIPGVILFVFGYPLIFGWWSMLLLPITLLVFGVLRRWQERHVLRRLHIQQPPDKRGFLGYLIAYQALTSWASLRGYAQFISGSTRRWK